MRVVEESEFVDHDVHGRRDHYSSAGTHRSTPDHCGSGNDRCPRARRGSDHHCRSRPEWTDRCEEGAVLFADRGDRHEQQRPDLCVPVHGGRSDARSLGVGPRQSRRANRGTALLLVGGFLVVVLGCAAPSTSTGLAGTSTLPAPETTAPAAGTVAPETSPPSPPTELAVGDMPGTMPAPGTCTLRPQGDLVLPDPACTPGTIDSAVTPGTIKDTICKTGWTTTIRPPASKTNKMKAQSAMSYSIATTTTGEYDHLVSLQLGGAPADPRNLWFEPGLIPNPKDAIETKLNQGVCSGLITLAAAQVAIATDWTTALDVTGLTAVGSKTCLRGQPNRCATSASRSE
jgi:hypothetical protein